MPAGQSVRADAVFDHRRQRHQQEHHGYPVAGQQAGGVRNPACAERRTRRTDQGRGECRHRAGADQDDRTAGLKVRRRVAGGVATWVTTVTGSDRSLVLNHGDHGRRLLGCGQGQLDADPGCGDEDQQRGAAEQPPDDPRRRPLSRLFRRAPGRARARPPPSESPSADPETTRGTDLSCSLSLIPRVDK